MGDNLKNIKINPGYKSGTVRIPSSKSISLRAVICAGLAGLCGSASNIGNIDLSQDITATVEAMRGIGADCKICGDIIKISSDERPFDNYINEIVIDCRESGSALRFLIPIAAALGITSVFVGEGRLPERPIRLYQELFKDKGVDMQYIENEDRLPVKITGKLSSGKFYIPGNISSQFITGLLLACPLLGGDSEIILTSVLESKPYVDITIDVLKSFGIIIEENKGGYRIQGKQKCKGLDYTVEGDYSQSAFFACMGAINGDISINNLNIDSYQGDSEIIDILRDFGADVYFEDGILRSRKNTDKKLRGIKIDASQAPDLIPVLSVVAAYADGETIIYNAERLRLKESDRIAATVEMLTAIGAEVEETDDGLIIVGNGGKKLPGGFVMSCNDHRIAMSAAISAVGTENGVIIDDMACINKTYPMFLRDFESLNK